jgi:hypothetical protein
MASTFSSVIQLLLSVFDFIRGRSDRKRKRLDVLEDRIKAIQRDIAKALEDGRITDVATLRMELDGLKKEYDKLGGKRASVAAATGMLLFLAITPFLSGCFSTRSDPSTPYVVVGERIIILEPGSELVVPELVPPAKKWYLIDNIGLQVGLGIPMLLENDR